MGVVLRRFIQVAIGDLYEVIKKIEEIANVIRNKFLDDIEMFFREGYSNHDCYEINSEIAKKIKSRLGLYARVVRVSFLENYGVKHYVVEVDIGSDIIVVDAVPELTGLIPSWYEVGSPFIGTYKEYEKFFSKVLSLQY